ncbi:MAG TPA: diguanylate cyclase [Dehalococcoidia bacterium]|nr:diguanylate cyclase [Dehalococcoidia bacterium]
MPSAIHELGELARLAGGEPGDEALRSALGRIRDLLGSEEIVLIDGSQGRYATFGGDAALSDTAIWLVQRHLIAAGGPCAFTLEGGEPQFAGTARKRRGAGYLAGLIPCRQAPAHILLARAPWARGRMGTRLALLRACLPALGQLIDRRVAFTAAVEERDEVDAIEAISLADGIDALLQRAARMTATLAGFEYATLVVVDDAQQVRHFATNYDIPEALRPPAPETVPDAEFRRAVLDRRMSLYFEDVQTDERVPRALRQYFATIQLRSLCALPLVTGNRAVGFMMVSSYRARSFGPAEREQLARLSASVARAVGAVLVGNALAATEYRMQFVAAHAPIVLFAMNRDGVFTLSEGRGLERLGLRPGEVVGKSVFDVYADVPDVCTSIRRALAGEAFTTIARVGELAYETHYAPIFEPGGEVSGVVGVATDVTEQTRALEQLAEQARRDPLTGVLNHAAITALVEDGIRRGEPFAVAMVDVDGMKVVNDTYGHLSGDAVLRAVASTLGVDGATAGRYGGDEFLVLVPCADRESAERYAATVAETIHETRLIDEDTSATIRPPVSIGVAVFPEEGTTLVDLIKVADSAMYAAKSRRARELGVTARRLDDRVSAMIGDLVPLLTSPGDLNAKLRLVAGRLSTGTGYDAVDCQVFSEADHAQSTLQDGNSDVLTEQWRAEQTKNGRAPHRPINVILRKTGRPIILEDLSMDERLTDVERALLTGAGLQSAIVAPMLWNNELIGTLAVARRQRGAFEPRDAQFLAAVASQMTAIVRMAGLVEGLQKATDRLSESQAETVMMLAAAAEAHDRTTGLHLASIRSLTEAIAAELGYDAAAVRELGLAATLHDIGKISVPDAILSSPVRFDSDDWEIARMWQTMKQHSVWGAEFLAARPGFELASKVARWHHERWDGGGYPDGLAGTAIPEEVTIVTVADALDAMVQDRPYRAGRPLQEAIDELVRCRGAQFNPTVVDAVVRLARRGALPCASHTEEEPLAA